MTDYSTRVNISISQRQRLEDYADYDFSFSFDAAEFSVSQWFDVFEKILANVGFSESAIVNLHRQWSRRTGLQRNTQAAGYEDCL